MPLLSSRFSMAIRLATGGALLGVGSTGPALADAASEMLSHRALYSLSAARIADRASIADVGGAMVFSWERQCAGWDTEQRMILHYEYEDGRQARLLSEFTSFEAMDGSHFEFTSREGASGGSLSLSVQGDANQVDSTGGQVIHQVPSGLSFDLEAETVFPTAFSFDIMDRAAAGELFHTATLFDGSDEEGPMYVATVMTPMEQRATPLALAGTAANTSRFLIRSAYYPGGSNDMAPEFEMSYVITSNGIVEHLDIIYEDFTLNGELTDFETIEPHECPRDG